MSCRIGAGNPSILTTRGGGKYPFIILKKKRGGKEGLAVDVEAGLGGWGVEVHAGLDSKILPAASLPR